MIRFFVRIVGGGEYVNVEVFVLCDAATDSQGKLNILGAFDTLFVASVPATHSQCSVAARLRWERIEGEDHRIAIHVVNQDGKPVIPPLEGNIKVSFPQNASTAVTNIILNIQGLKLDSFAEHSVDLVVDSKHEASLPLYVKPVPSS